MCDVLPFRTFEQGERDGEPIRRRISTVPRLVGARPLGRFSVRKHGQAANTRLGPRRTLKRRERRAPRWWCHRDAPPIRRPIGAGSNRPELEGPGPKISRPDWLLSPIAARVVFVQRIAWISNVRAPNRPAMEPNDFEQIVSAHYEALYRFALSLTRAESDALDLTQQTFYVWAAKGHQLRDRSKAKAWLFTTLHRAFLGTRQRHARFPHHGLEEVPIEDLPAFSPDFANAVDSPQVVSALAKVDQVYQAAVALFYLEDCSYQEIAEILEVPLGTVKSRIARGIMQLRQLLGVSAPERPPETAPRSVNCQRARGAS